MKEYFYSTVTLHFNAKNTNVSVDSSNEGMKCTQKPLYALIILNVKPSSAADEAGLQAGHQIIKMNGQNVNHLTYSDICRITESFSLVDNL
ncbi:unnamed protein product [Wuchereria bancrofti]|uniref:PDZ domain-containing protein n=1 Tax=Wuchereria bancrofti TaxID=6293 RepID=A0A3P7DS69_WUCBA|nr:unnamed protein product [Wuchereria bancrofti]